MRVIQIANASSIGGGNRSLLQLNGVLRSRRTTLHVVIPSVGPMEDACLNESISYECASPRQPSWTRPDLLWADYRRWRERLIRTSTDIVHANDVTTARWVALAAWRGRVPLVCHVRFPPDKAEIAWAFRRLPKPAALIFNSYALRNQCGADFEQACPGAEQFVIHNAVDLKQFQPRPKRSQKKRVGILANLTPVKGHHDFLRMARRLLDQGVDAEYWIIGEDIQDSGYGVESKRLCRELGLADSVQFLGYRTDVANLLNELDVLVCASHVEPFGRCLIEAMACVKPVVATRVGGIPEVVDDEITGILVPPGSPQKLADAASRLLNDRELSARMGNAGRRRVERCFTPDAHADAVLDVYQSVLSRANRSR